MRNKPAPPAKWQIRDHLLNQLYQPVRERQDQEIRGLIERNTVLLQQRDKALHKRIMHESFHRSFAYNGKFYSIEPDPGPPVRNPLHPSLEQEMREHVEHYQQAEHELLLVKGFFDSMLAFSSSAADCCLILPESLKEPFLQILAPESREVLTIRTLEEIEAFMAKHRPRYDLIRQRMAINLIL